MELVDPVAVWNFLTPSTERYFTELISDVERFSQMFAHEKIMQSQMREKEFGKLFKRGKDVIPEAT